MSTERPEWADKLVKEVQDKIALDEYRSALRALRQLYPGVVFSVTARDVKDANTAQMLEAVLNADSDISWVLEDAVTSELAKMLAVPWPGEVLCKSTSPAKPYRQCERAKDHVGEHWSRDGKMVVERWGSPGVEVIKTHGQKAPADLFRCGKCGKTFKRGDRTMTCAVMHSPGDCCHYTDIQGMWLCNLDEYHKGDCNMVFVANADFTGEGCFKR